MFVHGWFQYVILDIRFESNDIYNKKIQFNLMSAQNKSA